MSAESYYGICKKCGASLTQWEWENRQALNCECNLCQRTKRVERVKQAVDKQILELHTQPKPKILSLESKAKIVTVFRDSHGDWWIATEDIELLAPDFDNETSLRLSLVTLEEAQKAIYDTQVLQQNLDKLECEKLEALNNGLEKIAFENSLKVDKINEILESYSAEIPDKIWIRLRSVLK